MKTILTDGAPSISSRIRQLGLELGVSTACIWVDDWIRWWNTSGLRSSLYICVIVGVFNCYHILIVFNENKWIRCWRKETPSRKQGSTMFHIQMLWLPIISMCSSLALRTGTEIELGGGCTCQRLPSSWFLCAKDGRFSTPFQPSGITAIAALQPS